jgi:hypothetical protein
VFVANVYGPNAILVCPMHSRSDAEMIRAYQDIYEFLEARGYSSQSSMFIMSGTMNAQK